MQILTLKIEGTSPLMMHNERLANPLDPIARRIKEVAGKRKKTDDDHVLIMELEFEGGLYFDEEIGPYLPDKCIEGMIVDGAKKHRGGTKVSEGLIVQEAKTRLEYKGPRDVKGLWKANTFRDVRSVVISGKRVMRCRPIFPIWWAQFTVAFDEKIINRDDLVLWIQTAGQQTGFMEYRPKMGRFTVEVLANKA